MLTSKTETKVIAVNSQKGGPGKTTLSCNIANELALRGNKTILVDLDVNQPTIQFLFHIPKDVIKYTINDLLLGRIRVLDDALTPTSNENLSVIVADETVEYGEGLLSLLTQIQEHSFFMLREMVTQFQRMGYKYIVFDCAPGYRIESANAAAIADARVFVMRPNTFSYEGTKTMLEVLYKKLDVGAANFLVFNQVPQSLSTETKTIIENWKTDIIESYKPNKIDFLCQIPIEDTYMENSILGKYIMTPKSPLYKYLTIIVDKLSQTLENEDT